MNIQELKEALKEKLENLTRYKDDIADESSEIEDCADSIESQISDLQYAQRLIDDRVSDINDYISEVEEILEETIEQQELTISGQEDAIKKLTKQMEAYRTAYEGLTADISIIEAHLKSDLDRIEAEFREKESEDDESDDLDETAEG